MDANKLLEEIYTRIDALIRSAVKEALEDAFKKSPPEKHNTDDDLIASEQAAEFLKIKISTLYSKVEKGDLPHYRSGKRKLLFSKKELATYVVRRKGKSAREISDEVDDYILSKPLRRR